MLKIAIDTGGTFTDYTAWGTIDNKEKRLFVKNPTNHRNPAAGIIDGLKELALGCEVELPALLEQTASIAHGATLALNALLEKKGVKTALFTTLGFRDALEIRRSQLKNQWDLRALAPEVLVPRRLRLGIKERLNYAGEELLALDEDSVRQACKKCAEQGVKAVAVCFLFSFLNPEHEERTAAIIREELPGVFVSLSSQVAPRIREYERTVTTVINAYLTPVLADYLVKVKEGLDQYGWDKPINIMTNSGALSDIDAISDCAVTTLLSGPGGGAVGNAALGKLCQRSHMVLADMGGTSFDLHLISGGKGRLVSDSDLAGYPLTVPMIDISSIGAGGGSIVRVDASGAVTVGPESAGSVPGPACYGLGGVEATVTDALVALGIVNTNNFLGGRMALDRAAGEKAIMDGVARPLGVTLEEAGEIIYRVAAGLMADALRLETMERGNDPREYSLIAAGGAFPLFAANIAADLHMPEVLVPVQGPVFCSWGMLGACRGYDTGRSFFMEKEKFQPNAINDVIDELLAKAHREMTRLKVPQENRDVEVVLAMRYVGQHHEINIPWHLGRFQVSDLAALDKAFHTTHREIFQYAEEDLPWEIIDIRLSCREKQRDNKFFQFQDSEPYQAVSNMNGAAFGIKGKAKVGIYNEGALVGSDIHGPALINFDYTTAVVPCGFKAKCSYPGILSLIKVGE